MSLVTIQSNPPPEIMAILDQRDWPRLKQCLEQGFPANAAWACHGSLFERFVVASSVPHRSLPGTQAHAQQMAVIEAFLNAGLKEQGAFHGTVSHSMPMAICALMGRTDYVDSLLRAGHSPNGLGHGMPSPLSILASRKMVGESNPVYLPFLFIRPCLNLLLKHKADPNQPAEEGWLPLSLAVSSGDWEVSRALLDAGANPNGKASGIAIEPGPRFTPLAWAIYKNDGHLTQVLIERGANLLARVTKDQISLVELAGQTAGPDVWRVILNALSWDHEEVQRGWFRAVAFNSSMVVHWFLCAGYDPRPLNQWGWSALQLAMKHDAWDVAKLLARLDLFDPHAPDPEGSSAYLRAKRLRGKEGLLDIGWQTTLVAINGSQGGKN